MKNRLLSLLLAAGLFATASGASAPVALFYSFDSSPDEVAFAQVRSELSQILDGTGLALTWHAMGHNSSEEAGDLYVVRFHGACFVPSRDRRGANLREDQRSLAATQISDGRVLPFADFWCDRVQRYIGSDANMPRALARVVAHELFHMMTGSRTHAAKGIAAPEYTRDNLTSAKLLFATGELQWLRSWAAARAIPHGTVLTQDLAFAADAESDTGR